MGRAAVILAAGQGTRMKSSLPKVLHPVGGRAMIDWSIALARETGCEKIVVVSSPDNEALKAHVTKSLGTESLAIQSPAQGTGHAVRCAEDALAGFSGQVVVLYGDTPLIPKRAVEDAFGALSQGADVAVLGFENPQPGAYGRLIERADGWLDRIVEAKDADDKERAVTLCNSGVMAADAAVLFSTLRKVTNENKNNEYYLTDVVGLANADGRRAKAVRCDMAEVMGVNSRLELAAAEAAFQARRRKEAMLSGVTLTAPETVFFAHDTVLEPDVTIEPNVVFGPRVHIRSGAIVRAFSHIEGAEIGPRAEVGPFARLRPGALLSEGAKVGNFVEVKNVTMGKGAKANHLSYLGDGDVGAGANIGAGTIFCNYDGFFKHRTVVGDGAFIGSNSALVAPVTIGKDAMVGSGSVVTRDVAAESLALARGEQVEKPGWAKRFRDAMRAKKSKGTSQL